MEILKNCVTKKDFHKLSINMDFSAIPFLKNDWGGFYGASRFFRQLQEEFDVSFYSYDIGKFKTLDELLKLIQHKQERKKKLNDPSKKYICYSATYEKKGLQYIGITCKGLEERKKHHIRNAKKGKGSLFQLALRELGEENFEWKIEARGNKKEMQRYEMKLIIEKMPRLNSQYVDWELHDEMKIETEINNQYEKYLKENNLEDDFYLYREFRAEIS